ncbi:MAG TPA: response regulator [Anaerolineae bacterium]|nr:response regulator [Anaerolineae bacterium]
MTKILIIDDDPDIVTSTRLCLEANDYEVIDAKNGTEGLEMIKTEHPDLIILDVMMDTTTEGFQLTLQLRSPDPSSEFKPYRNIPILMLTSIHSTTSLRFGPTEDYLPVDEFVDKPIDPDDLLQKVEKLLKRDSSP